MKKTFISLLLVFVMLLSSASSVFASTRIDKTLTTKKDQKSDDLKKLDKILKKYNLERLNEEEVKALNLNTTNTQHASISIDELEQLII